MCIRDSHQAVVVVEIGIHGLPVDRDDTEHKGEDYAYHNDGNNQGFHPFKRTQSCLAADCAAARPAFGCGQGFLLIFLLFAHGSAASFFLLKPKAAFQQRHKIQS